MRAKEVLILLNILGVQGERNYCDISRHHIMCRFKGPAPNCKPSVNGLTADEKQTILDAHNKLRAEVAAGKTRLPSASNMIQLVWDNELATIAQREADQCETRIDVCGENNKNYGECRVVERFGVGVYRGSHFQTDNKDLSPDWSWKIDEWYDALRTYPTSRISKFSSSSSTDGWGYGSFSEMLWATTSKLGCGFNGISKSTGFYKLYVCYYGPRGNMLGSPIYLTGKECSKCPEHLPACSASYPGLCEAGSIPILLDLPISSTDQPISSTSCPCPCEAGSSSSQNRKRRSGRSEDETAPQKNGKLSDEKKSAKESSPARHKSANGKTESKKPSVGKSNENKSVKNKTSNGKSGKENTGNGKSAKENTGNGKSLKGKSADKKSGQDNKVKEKTEMGKSEKRG